MPINGPSLPITEDDATIRRMVEDAELPALLVSLAHLTRDTSLIRQELRPPLRSMPTGAEPQGGMTPEIQAVAKECCFQAIKRYRDAGCPEPAELATAEMLRLIEFITGKGNDKYLSLLLHELGIPSDAGAPNWSKSEIEPLRQFRVAIIGAGMSGLVMAHRLSQAGIEFVVFEKNPEVGGTWWENSYPGCRLDTSNFAYSYSFAQKDDWPSQYSTQRTIADYFCEVANLFDLRKSIRFEREVISADFDDHKKVWQLGIRLPSGAIEKSTFQAIVSAVGQLNRPKMPDIPGREHFTGPAFHSARWRSDVDLEGKRVGVIGTGASAFQIIPSIADKVAELTIYQRTPTWMLPAPNYHKALPVGLMWLFSHLPFYHRWFRFYQFWVSSENRLPFFQIEDGWPSKHSVSPANDRLRQALYDHMAPQYEDRPDLLAKVIPEHPPGAKRMLRDNGVWAATLKRSNVELVTTPIVEITRNSVKTVDECERVADVIIYATGFNASDFLEPMKVRGADGIDLHDFWGGDARAYLGGCVPGFPNLFSVFGPNTALVINGSIFFMSECGVNYILGCLRMLLETGRRAMDVRAEAFQRYCAEVDAGNARMAWGGISLVNSWYRNKFGRAAQAWPFTLGDFWTRTRAPDPSCFILE